ncbi:hypothetical protein DL767_000707 [Monosporascus sp. MG133]|nr:hypothetical protein DL767_000707 [Monosporascus sp. MG133]
MSPVLVVDVFKLSTFTNKFGKSMGTKTSASLSSYEEVGNDMVCREFDAPFLLFEIQPDVIKQPNDAAPFWLFHRAAFNPAMTSGVSDSCQVILMVPKHQVLKEVFRITGRVCVDLKRQTTRIGRPPSAENRKETPDCSRNGDIVVSVFLMAFGYFAIWAPVRSKLDTKTYMLNGPPGLRPL